MKDYLPIGTVVLLNNAEHKLMIYGIKQMDSAHPESEFDYIGVLYPEGNMGPHFQYLFNHDDIDQICFRGYDDEERAAFIDKIKAALEEN